jgi:hypothetical protein
VDYLDKLPSTITSTAANICGFQPALTPGNEKLHFSNNISQKRTV